jgi:hypothetical protein
LTPPAAGAAVGLGHFWRRWIAANALAELFGLGGVALVGWLAYRHFGEPQGAAEALIWAAGMVALGAFEGVVVGIAQAQVLRRVRPALGGWVAATVVGAMLAWAVGMLPSTLMNLRPAASATQAGAEPPLVVVLLLAAALGAVAGPLLAVFQWRRLRTIVPRGALAWLPANAAAWALGMPIIFLGVQADELQAGLVLTGAAVALSLLAAGAVVGAVHGRVLLWVLWRDEARATVA